MTVSAFSPTLGDVLNALMETIMGRISVAIPGEVVSVNGRTVNVQPLVTDRIKTGNGEFTEALPVIPNVPMVQLESASYGVRLPTAKGDKCLLLTCDRSISQWYLGSGEQKDPEDFRKHDITDSVAIFGLFPRDTADFPELDHLVIGHKSGAQIHVKEDQIDLYEENAADFVALSQKTFDSIDALRGELQSFISQTFNTHVHGTAGTPPTIPVVTPLPPTQGVAAEKVKAT